LGLDELSTNKYEVKLMEIADAFKLLANAATILGVPIAIVVYLNEKRKERREREYGTFNALDDKYLDYLNLCITNPRLDLYYLPFDGKTTLSREERIQQYAMFEILISLMERAFLMYRDQSTEIKKSQWEGWDQYMTHWASRPIFQTLWLRLGDQFAEEFMEHMNQLIKNMDTRS
jgi:hypothetical protein